MHDEIRLLALFVKSFCFLLALGLFFVVAGAYVRGPVQRDAYMGAEYCGSCHKQEYRWWLQDSHSHAHKLIAGQKENDSSCKKCHQTPVSHDEEVFAKKITCESCHGPGKYYSPAHFKRDTKLAKLLFKRSAEESCIDCHTKKAQDSIWLHKNLKKIHHGQKLKEKTKKSGP